MTDDFSPAAATRRVIGAWVWVAGFILMGGLLGWLIHSLRTPLYEGRATLRMGIDYTRTGWPNEIEEDRAIELAGFVFTSRPVLEETAAAANAEGISITADEFFKSLALERRSYTWILRVLNPRPQTAARLAELWLQTGLKTLDRAMEHAFKAEELRRQVDGLETCLADAARVDPAGGLCSIQTLAELQAQLAVTGAAYQQERTASLGLSTAVLYGEGEPVTLPERPVLYGRAGMMAAGMGIGLVLALLLTGLGWLPGLRVKSKRTDVSTPDQQA